MNVVLRFASSCNLVVLFVVDGRRAVVFRRYVASRGGPAPVAQACQSLVVCCFCSIDDRSCGLVDVFCCLVTWMTFFVVSSTSFSACLGKSNAPEDFSTLVGASFAMSFVAQVRRFLGS